MTTSCPPQTPITVLEDRRHVAAVLPPLRRLILRNLDEADSATGLAGKLGLARQKINYHLRELEKAGLVTCVEERQKRGCVERRLRATSRAYVVSPSFLGALAADPDRLRDRFSSAYLMASASRMLQEVGVLRNRAAAIDQDLVTMTIESEICFASPEDLKSFSEELTARVASLVAEYHKPRSSGSRPYRFTVGGHPKITKTEAEAVIEQAEHATTKAPRNQERSDERSRRQDP